MGLKDRIVRALALRWLRGKLGKWKDGGSDVWKFMNGQKGKWFCILYLVAWVVNYLTGTDITAWLDMGIKAAGMSDVLLIEVAKQFAASWGAPVAAFVIAAHGLYKQYKQRKAGATLGEVGSLVGQVKAAMVSGQITLPDAEMAKTHGPSVILVEGHPFEVPKGA